MLKFEGILLEKTKLALDTNDPKHSPETIIKCARQLDIKMQMCSSRGSIADIRARKKMLEPRL
jgi:hypothetical protein